MFNEPDYNFFDENLVQRRDTEVYSVERKQLITTSILEGITAENLPEGQNIAFLSVDVKGLDSNVLQSNNSILYRLKYVLVEYLCLNPVDIKKNGVYSLLNKKL